MPEFEIRRAQESAWEQFYPFLLQHDQPLDSLDAALERYRYRLSSSLHCVFVAEVSAEVKGRIVGICLAHEWDHLLMSGRKQIRFSSLEVLPEFQRRGIGTALFVAARDWAQDAGATWFEWYASLSAVPFYERLGYAGTGDPDPKHPYFEIDFRGLTPPPQG